MLSKITPRQEDVLRLLVLGWTNQEIAERLNIATATVKHHLAALFRWAEIRGGDRRVKLAVGVMSAEITRRLLEEDQKVGVDIL